MFTGQLPRHKQWQRNQTDSGFENESATVTDLFELIEQEYQLQYFLTENVKTTKIVVSYTDNSITYKISQSHQTVVVTMLLM